MEIGQAGRPRWLETAKSVRDECAVGGENGGCCASRISLPTVVQIVSAGLAELDLVLHEAVRRQSIIGRSANIKNRSTTGGRIVCHCPKGRRAIDDRAFGFAFEGDERFGGTL